MWRPLYLLLFVFLAVADRHAFAGIVIKLETTVSTQDQPANATAALVPGGAPRQRIVSFKQPVEVLIDSDRLRLVFQDGVTIYRGDLNRVWRLTDRSHLYTEQTPESVKKERSQTDQVLQRLQQQIRSTPPAQRKQLEDMDAEIERQIVGLRQTTQITYEKAGNVKNVGEWSCMPYRRMVGGVPESELCITNLHDVRLSRDDLKALVSYGAFKSQISDLAGGTTESRPMDAFDFDEMSTAIGFDGIPIQTYAMDGTVAVRSAIKSIERKNIPADTFEIPAGYTLPPDARTSFAVHYMDIPAKAQSK